MKIISLKHLKTVLFSGITGLVVLLAGLTVSKINVRALSNATLTRQVDRCAVARRAYQYPQIGANTRDLGGYPTRNPRYVTKRGFMIRSANLSGLKRRGAAQLKRLHVRQVIDFRYPYGNHGSIIQRPDPGELGTRDPYHLHLHYDYAPTYSYRQEVATTPGKDKHGEIYRYGVPFATAPAARASYRNVINQLLKKHRGAIMINCTGGRDRTGLASAIVLAALNVSRGNIARDYLLTDYYAHKMSYRKQLSELNHFYATVTRHYGSLNNYLHRGLGLNNQQLRKLRRMYLTRV